MDRLITTGLPQNELQRYCDDYKQTDGQREDVLNIPWSGGGVGGWFVNSEVIQTYMEGRSHSPTKLLAGSVGRWL